MKRMSSRPVEQRTARKRESHRVGHIARRVRGMAGGATAGKGGSVRSYGDPPLWQSRGEIVRRRLCEMIEKGVECRVIIPCENKDTSFANGTAGEPHNDCLEL